MLLLALAAVLTLRPDAPALTVEQARALTPAALGDALLAPGHEPVVEAQVGLAGLAPPPPPGIPWAVPITLYAAARAGTRPAFCEKLVATVRLAPAVAVHGAFPPSAPRELSTSRLYRWRPVAGCEAPRSAFFAADDERVFTVVRLLAEARRRAQRGAVPFAVTIDDLVGREAAARPGPQPSDWRREIVDGRAALAAFPVDGIGWIGDARQMIDWQAAPDREAVTADGRPREVVGIFAGDGLWAARVTLDGDRIVHVAMRRAIPAPF